MTTANDRDDRHNDNVCMCVCCCYVMFVACMKNQYQKKVFFFVGSLHHCCHFFPPPDRPRNMCRRPLVILLLRGGFFTHSWKEFDNCVDKKGEEVGHFPRTSFVVERLRAEKEAKNIFPPYANRPYKTYTIYRLTLNITHSMRAY